MLSDERLKGKDTTWGDTLMDSNQRRIRVEPMTQTRKLYPEIKNSMVDGELYTDRYTRGNLRSRDMDTGDTFLLHPFTGGFSPLPMRAY